jgi:hypothetical protein
MDSCIMLVGGGIGLGGSSAVINSAALLSKSRPTTHSSGPRYAAKNYTLFRLVLLSKAILYLGAAAELNRWAASPTSNVRS